MFERRIVLAAALAACCSAASAEEFNAALAKLGNTINGSAQIDVSLESTNGANTPVDVTVFRADGTRDDFQIMTNGNGFATTSSVKDLFVAAKGQDALVQVRTPSGVEASTAILRQKIGSQKIVLGVPPAIRAGVRIGSGTQFSIPLGDVGRGAFLLIGNITDGQTAEVSVYRGSAVFSPFASNGELGVHKVWRVPLSSGGAHIVIRSSIPVSVQLAIDDGKVDQVTLIGM